MNKTFCDICEKELTPDNKWNLKVKVRGVVFLLSNYEREFPEVCKVCLFKLILQCLECDSEFRKYYKEVK